MIFYSIYKNFDITITSLLVAYNKSVDQIERNL